MTKLSRSKIELFIDCPRCFWLDLKKGVKHPPPAPYTINNAIDYLLKQEFDTYREKGLPHPIMKENKLDAIPFKHADINKWRHNFTGVQYKHEPLDFLVYGAVDDVWVNPAGELIVVDYKATGANQHQIYDSYGRQMEIYQWLLRRSGFQVSPFGYFVFARVDKSGGFEKRSLSFNIFLETHRGDDGWIEGALAGARKCVDSEKAPAASSDCGYCEYRANAIGV